MRSGSIPERNPVPDEAARVERLLGSWKEIAQYLQRTERTVQRWEQTEGLPVHRHLHERRSSVYAYRHELDKWWKNRNDALPPADTAPPHSRRYLTITIITGATLVIAVIVSLFMDL